MGLISSGDVSDASLLHRLEVPCTLDQSTRDRFQLKFYARFKDDIFMVVGGSRENATDLFSLMRKHSGVFKLKCDEVSKVKVCMLDIALFKGSSNVPAPLKHCIHLKPSSHWRPLSMESMHPPSVHRSWPIAQMVRIRSLCSSKSMRAQHLESFLYRLKEAGSCWYACKSRTPTNRVDKRSHRYLVLPFSFPLKSVAGLLTRSLEEVRAKWVCHDSNLPITRIAWSLGAKHLITRLKHQL